MRVVSAMIAVLLFAGTAGAQEAEREKMLLTQSPCATYDEMVAMVDKHGEKPLFIGEGLTFQAGRGTPYRGGMFFTVNQDEGNWTIFQLFGDGMTCMLMNGGKFQPYWGE